MREICDKYRVKQVSERSYHSVVSPLVNLMKDQATKLANIGIAAVTLSVIIAKRI